MDFNPNDTGPVKIEFFDDDGYDRFPVATTAGSAKTFEPGRIYEVSALMYQEASNRYGLRVQRVRDDDPRLGGAGEPEALQSVQPIDKLSDEQKAKLEAAILEILDTDDNDELLDKQGRPTPAALQERGITFEWAPTQFGVALKAARLKIKQRGESKA